MSEPTDGGGHPPRGALAAPDHRTGRRGRRIAAPLRALRRMDRVFGRTRADREAGGATVEFVLLLPVFIAMFMMSFEAALILTRSVMLERAVDLAVRDLRLDPGSVITASRLQNDVCERSRILPDCRDNLLIELTTVSQTSWALPVPSRPCIYGTPTVTPSVNYDGNRAEQLVLLRACYSVAPTFPTSLLGSRTIADGSGQARLLATSAFVVEPAG